MSRPKNYFQKKKIQRKNEKIHIIRLLLIVFLFQNVFEVISILKKNHLFIFNLFPIKKDNVFAADF